MYCLSIGLSAIKPLEDLCGKQYTDIYQPLQESRFTGQSVRTADGSLVVLGGERVHKIDLVGQTFDSQWPGFNDASNVACLSKWNLKNTYSIRAPYVEILKKLFTNYLNLVF